MSHILEVQAAEGRSQGQRWVWGRWAQQMGDPWVEEAEPGGVTERASLDSGVLLEEGGCQRPCSRKKGRACFPTERAG